MSILTMLSYHPLVLICSFLVASVVIFYLRGVRGLALSLKHIILLFAIVFVLTFLLSALKNWQFALASAAMLATLMLWAEVFNLSINDGELMLIIGRWFEKTALAVAMVRNLIPTLMGAWREMKIANMALTGKIYQKIPYIERIKSNAKLIVGLFGLCIDIGIEKAFLLELRAVSLGEAKGKTKPRRTSIYTRTPRPIDMLSYCLVAIIFVALAYLEIKLK